jgi:hypothetical protein
LDAFDVPTLTLLVIFRPLIFFGNLPIAAANVLASSFAAAGQFDWLIAAIVFLTFALIAFLYRFASAGPMRNLVSCSMVVVVIVPAAEACWLVAITVTASILSITIILFFIFLFAVVQAFFTPGFSRCLTCSSRGAWISCRPPSTRESCLAASALVFPFLTSFSGNGGARFSKKICY